MSRHLPSPPVSQTAAALDKPNEAQSRLHAHPAEEWLQCLLATGADVVLLFEVQVVEEVEDEAALPKYRVNYLQSNATARHLLGLSEAQLSARAHDDARWNWATFEGEPLPPERWPIIRVLRDNSELVGLELSVMGANERRVPLRVRVAPLRDAAGSITGVALCGCDLTEHRVLEERLLHQALHDPLTMLPNRALLLNRIEHALAQRERESGPLAVMLIDMDNFKWINDSLGHAAGDQMLVQLAGRLQNALRAADTVGRFGGDEFVVLIDHLGNPAYALGVADRLVEVLSQPLNVDGQRIHPSPSIGVTFSSPDVSTPGELLRRADAAMYEAKRRGKACVEVFRDDLGDAMRRRLELASDLRRAVECDELVLHYQPKLDLRSGQVCGFEALVRWQHPQRGLLAPSEFIALAEEMGLIVPIGRWVLREACRQARRWMNAAPRPGTLEDAATLSISVNISAHQLREIRAVQTRAEFESPEDDNSSLTPFGLIADVQSALESSGLSPSHLILEITESVAMEEADIALGALHGLKALGVKLAIDDFGTGYSSLAYLKMFPLDFLKIDRRFITDLREQHDSLIIDSMVSLAHALELTVVAEGVETAEDTQLLRNLGCDLAQGFFYSRPMTAADANLFLHAAPPEHYPRTDVFSRGVNGSNFSKPAH